MKRALSVSVGMTKGQGTDPGGGKTRDSAKASEAGSGDESGRLQDKHVHRQPDACLVQAAGTRRGPPDLSKLQGEPQVLLLQLLHCGGQRVGPQGRAAH